MRTLLLLASLCVGLSVAGLTSQGPRILDARTLEAVKGAATYTCWEDIGGGDCYWWNDPIFGFVPCPQAQGTCLVCEDTTTLADNCVQSPADNCVFDDEDKDCGRLMQGQCSGSTCTNLSPVGGSECDDMTNCYNE